MPIVIHAQEDLECCGLLNTWEGISNGPSAESKNPRRPTDHQKQLRLWCRDVGSTAEEIGFLKTPESIRSATIAGFAAGTLPTSP
jgi:hypothetical protein